MDFGYGETRLGIEDLTIGISNEGMEQYIEDLRFQLLEEVRKKIEDDDELVNALNSCWQGAARDTFLINLRLTENTVIEDLQLEFEDVKQRLTELKAFYWNLDQSMADSQEDNGGGVSSGMGSSTGKSTKAVGSSFGK